MKGTWHLLAFSALLAVAVKTWHLIVVVIVFVWLWHLMKQSRLTPAQVIVICTGIIFFYWFTGFQTPKNEQVQANSGEIIGLTGNIVSEVRVKSYGLEFVLKGDDQNDYLVSYFSKGDVNADVLNQLQTGASCNLKGKVEIPESSSNPGQFNYQNYLRNKGIQYLFQVQVETNSSVNCTGSSFLQQVYNVRQFVLSKANDNLSSFTAGWVKALVLGDNEGIDPGTIELFQRFGLSHLLAISGLHVGLLVGGLYYVFVKFNIVTKEKAQTLILLIVALYPLIGGGSPSVWRASLMTMFTIVLVKIRVPLQVTDIVSLTFLLLYLIDPPNLYQLGFQFSFLVSFALLLSQKLWNNTRPMYQILLVSFISSLSILPIQVYNFYYFNPVSLLVNLIIVPYFSFYVMPFMLLLLLLSLTFPDLVSFLDVVFRLSHETVLQILELMDKFLFFPWVIGKFPLAFFIPYYLLFIMMMVSIGENKKKKAFLLGSCLTMLLVTISLKPYVSPQGTITMLDVGQGDSFIIELPYRKGVIMIDAAGSLDGNFEPSNKRFEQVIKPFLYSRGIARIDQVILTHPDLDHVGSFPYLLDDFNIEKLIISDLYELPEDLQNKMQNKIEIVRVSDKDKISIGTSVFNVLHPGNSNDLFGTNETSLVVFTKIGGLRWLFTGDIDEGVESLLLKKYPNLKADVLKVAHHGSKTSTSEAWIDQLTPKYAWVSVGANNSYGHPNPDVIRRLRDNRVVLLRTDKLGAIQYNFSGNKGTLYRYSP
ncbi:DNA internalization-related competence protein ComEC/Rec2 [Aquibacillus salsiterrae]|uniref:DNA internalization-related competence protein ComEC/Rec2 n=1 Tax=Aquibacillus salsiterrae TaxID=2950439 RepID=A0A9X4ADK3_9BACI|nr:DNA internalization-related competence protein ComEC/Rec2 [Aquibacillus salsiterrae]MDC3415582.1 DNA internalization-related competence protein ComEC/Rec2 [Aquibacillus salsiterrae]